MDLAKLTELFQWMTIFNVAILIISAVLMMILRDIVCRMHGRLFGIEESQVAAIAYNYLGIYRLLVLVFNLVPWLALNMIQ